MQPSIALEATWRLIREANAHLEANEPWKVEPGPEVDAVLGDALEVLRLVAVLAAPGHAPARAPRCGAASASPARPTDQRAPGRRGVGRLPGGLPVEKGAPLFPRISARPTS